MQPQTVPKNIAWIVLLPVHDLVYHTGPRDSLSAKRVHLSTHAPEADAPHSGPLQSRLEDSGEHTAPPGKAQAPIRGSTVGETPSHVDGDMLIIRHIVMF